MSANNTPTNEKLVFTDEDLKELEKWLALPKNVLTRRRVVISRLIKRLKIAEAAVMLADCDCNGSAEVCKFYRFRDAWFKVSGRKLRTSEDVWDKEWDDLLKGVDPS